MSRLTSAGTRAWWMSRYQMVQGCSRMSSNGHRDASYWYTMPGKMKNNSSARTTMKGIQHARNRAVAGASWPVWCLADPPDRGECATTMHHSAQFSSVAASIHHWSTTASSPSGKWQGVCSAPSPEFMPSERSGRCSVSNHHRGALLRWTVMLPIHWQVARHGRCAWQQRAGPLPRGRQLALRWKG